MNLDLDQLAALEEIFAGCGRAMYDDGEYNCPSGSGGANGVNSFEAGTALDAVARVLGMVGPGAIYDDLCQGDV